MTDEPAGDDLAARVSALERTVAELEQRLRGLPSVAAAPHGAAAPHPAAAPPKVVAPPPVIPQALPSGLQAPAAVAGVAAKTTSAIDLETRIAGQWLNRIGLLAMAIGVSYFLKLAIDNDWIGPLGQVAIGLIFGVALLAATPALRQRGYTYFADGIAGLGGSVLYLSLWAGGSYYQLLSLNIAFLLMVVVTAGMLAIALTVDSQRVAVLALVGGFVSPALASSGRDAEITLFSYLIVLNAALLPIAWLRDWRWLDLPALVLTQLWFWLWDAQFYNESKRAVTGAFATVFFLQFLALPTLRAQRDGSVTWGHVILVPANAGVWLLVFASLFWTDARWTLTLIAVAMAAAHLAVAALVPVKSGKAEARLLMGGVALTLASLIIPIRLSGSWITMAWSIEAAVLMWAGFRASLQRMRVFAFVLLAVAGLRLVDLMNDHWLSDAPPVFNVRFAVEMVTILSFAAAVWMGARYRATLDWLERMVFNTVAVLVNVLAIAALTEEIRFAFRATEFRSRNGLAEELLVSLLWVAYAAALMVTGLRKKITAVRWQALALFGFAIVKVFLSDMSYLSGIYRVASSLALGAVLLVVSFLYQRSLRGAAGEKV